MSEKPRPSKPRQPPRTRARKRRLANGLTVITERLPGLRTLSVGIWIRAGTRHESAREAGLSHFLEHMAFKGTRRRSAAEITRAIERVGGEFNAFTAREFTCFHLSLLARDLDLGMEILADVLLGSTFSAEEFARERKVILQEIAMVDEAPEEAAQDRHFELAYARHSLGRSILGTASSVRKMRRRDLLAYFRRHYRPERMIVSVAGDVSEARVLASLGDLRKRSWPNRPAARRRGGAERAVDPAPVARTGTWWIPQPAEQAHLVWSVESPPYRAPEQPALLLIASYLGGGMSSALFQEIREKQGLAYTVYSALNTFRDTGMLQIYVGAKPSRVPQCLRLIERTARRLAREGIPARDLRETREGLQGAMLLSADSAESVMQSNAIDEIYFGEQFSIEQACAELETVTPAQIRSVARKLFGGGRRAVLVYGPRPRPSVRKALRPVFLKR